MSPLRAGVIARQPARDVAKRAARVREAVS
jgi:hypothetical protein